MLIRCGEFDISNRVLSCIKKGAFSDKRIIGQVPSFQLDLKLDNRDDYFNDKLNELFYYKEPGSNHELVFISYSKPERYTKELSLKLYDRSYELDVAYDTKLDYAGNSITINDQLDEMELLTGFIFARDTIPNFVLDTIVHWYDNTIVMRNYLGWIAELFGTNVFSTDINTFSFIPISKDSKHETMLVSDYQKEELYTISRVCFDNSIVKVDNGTLDNNTLYISCNNLYVEDTNASEIVNYVYSIVNGLSVYSLKKILAKDIYGLNLGDIINYNNEFLVMATDITSKVTTLNNISLDIKGQMVSKNEEKQVNKISNSTRVRALRVEFDQEKLKWSVTAEEVKSVGDRVESLNTSLTLEQGKIETLIKDNITIINGNEVTLKQAYSIMQQQIEQINFAISESGGNNKLLNSCGWNGLKYWETSGDVTSTTNNDIRSNTISGYAFNINVGTLQQSFKTIVGRKYSISCKIKKFTNSCTLIIKNGTSQDVLFNLNDEYIEGWVSFSMPIEAQDTSCTVYVESDGEYLLLSDFMVNDGEIPQQWSSSNDEIYTLNVKIDREGVEVSQDDTNNRTVMNTQEFAGYSGSERVFALNGDVTEVNKLVAKSDVQIGVVKMYAKTTGSKPGLGFAFVKR